MTDGQGEGFANKISIQTVAIVKAAQAAGRVYDVNSAGQAVCSLSFTISSQHL